MIGSEVLCEKYDLPDVVRIMRQLAIDSLHHGMGLIANQNCALEVDSGKRGESIEDAFPTRVPLRDQFNTRCSR